MKKKRSVRLALTFLMAFSSSIISKAHVVIHAINKNRINIKDSEILSQYGIDDAEIKDAINNEELVHLLISKGLIKTRESADSTACKLSFK